ncbi:hypothetical protein V8C35DRAFT_314336 [Trichoderma chlorosporum]
MDPASRRATSDEVHSRGLLRTGLAAAHEFDSVVDKTQVVPATKAARRPRHTRLRKRLALPIVIKGGKEPITVMACPDTGSDDNIISFELTKRLKLQLQLDEKDKIFYMANGKVVKALGQALIRCSFGAGNATDTTILECKVYVFESLAVPVIMGTGFLKETEIFTKHKDRLIEQIVPSMQALQVNSIGKPKRGLICRLDTFVGCANADTGSDLDLVSPQFAKQRGFNIEPGSEKLEFADGSFGYTSGVISASFTVGNVDDVRGFIPRGEILDLDFCVLDSLTSDILVGQETLESLDMFNQHYDSFIDSLPPQPGQSECNIIRHIGTIESSVKSTLISIQNLFGGRRDQNKTEPSDVIGRDNERERLMAVQRENAQQEALLFKRPSLTTLASVADRMLIDGINNPQIGSYACEFPGCTAPPFQTQYLLNAHRNVHSSVRPHYCPVTGCPRSEGGKGKGFKRKSEMIRHGLVHESPGFICPFCTDRVHKYPRPKHLQRHVRVHHADKNKDDPLLRDVLAQRLEGTSTSHGRRKRAQD